MDESLLPKELRTKNDSEAPRVSKVALTGKATIKKLNTRDKFREVVFNSDIGDVKEYIIYEEIVPRLINAFVTTVKNTLDLVFTSRASSRDRRSRRATSNRDYDFRIDRDYDDDRIPERRRREVIDRRSDRLIPISFDTMADAQAVLDEIVECLTMYERVRVSDYYEAANFSSTPTDTKYGWTSLKSASVRKDRDGWYIDLPAPKPFV